MHPGQRIGKYVLGDKIAVGGMAEVWAARAEGPEGFIKPVALKFILESFSGDPELERLFVKEARIAAQLQHANLVAVFDFDKVAADPEAGHAGRYYIAMEHVEGYDARRVVEAAKHAGYVFPLPLALYLGGEVLKGLRYVHERREKGRLLSLVHRDVSPHNVLVGFSGEVKLSDFGIAKSLAHSTRTKTGTIRGKLSYASPEQLNGEPVDQRTDQFAMGITLWEILAGRPLFDGNDEIEIVGKVMRCDVPPLALVCPERKVPAAVEAFTRRMLSPRRDQRFSTTTDALSALLALPGYSADGAPLGELVRTLFHRPSVGSTSTMGVPDTPVRAAGVRGREERRPPRRGAPARGPGRASGPAGPSERAPRPSDVETRTMAARSPALPAAGAGQGASPGPGPGAGRRSLAAGRSAAATTARVRPGWGALWRSWRVIAAVAAVAAVALAAAVLASGGRRGTSAAGASPTALEAEPSASPPSPAVAREAVPVAPVPAAEAPPVPVASPPSTAAGSQPPVPTAPTTEPPETATASRGARLPVRAASLPPPAPAPSSATPATSPPPVAVGSPAASTAAAKSMHGAPSAAAPSPPAAPRVEQPPGSFETAVITGRAAPSAAAHGDAAANGAPIVE